MKSFSKYNLTILDQIPSATFVINCESQVIYWNKACEVLTEVPAKDIIGTSDHWKCFYEQQRYCLADLVLKDDWEEYISLYEHINKNTSSERGLSAENWCRIASGYKYLIIDASAFYDEDGKMIGVVESLRDATQLIDTQQELKKLVIAVEDSPVATYIVDADNKFEYVNQKYTEIAGYSLQDVVGTHTRDYNSEEMSEELYEALLTTVRAGNAWKGVLAKKRKDGSTYWANTQISSVKDSQGNVQNYICIQQDISKELEEQAQLKYRAEHDGLTGLLNRKEFDKRLQFLLTDMRLREESNIVIFMDLDHLKRVNDNFGHDGGDNLLVDVAQILKTSMRDTDSVARFGGDESTM